MSQVKISGNASGTGVLTIAAPNTNTDRTINIPDTAGDIVTTGDSATITAGMLSGGQSGSAPIYAARAWIRMNGTGTIAIDDSQNVSSITDISTGRYTVNFTVALDSSQFAAAVNTPTAGYSGWWGVTTSSVNLYYNNTSNVVADINAISCIVVR